MRKGSKHSEETRKRIGLAGLGRTSPNKGRKLTKEHIEKIKNNRARQVIPPWTEERRIKFMGKMNPSWKGGITPVSTKIRNSKEYSLWRTAVFQRDNYTCVWCGIRNNKGVGFTVKLHADHIKPFAYYPELRLAIDNGRTLCIPCHKTTDTYAGKLIKYKKK